MLLVFLDDFLKTRTKIQKKIDICKFLTIFFLRSAKIYFCAGYKKGKETDGEKGDVPVDTSP
jgi:hypothetical protein